MKKSGFLKVLVFNLMLLTSCNSDTLWNRLNSQDFIFLEVLETDPASNETNVSVNTAIVVRLSDNIDQATLSSDNFYLNNGVVTLSYDYNETEKTITFIPAAPLVLSTEYCATLTTGIKTTVGESLEESYQWCFTTVSTDQPEIDVAIDSMPVLTGENYYFGFEEVGQSRAAVVEVFNNGSADLVLGAVTLGGSDAGVFSLDLAPLVTTIVPGNSSTFTVFYNPVAAGTHQATVTIPSNDMSETSFLINLTGSSSVDAQPEITVMQGNNIIPKLDGVYDFGTVKIGETSDTVTFTIKNTGTDDLFINSVILGDLNADEFNLYTTGMLSTLTPGSGTTFSVSFSPEANGSKKGSITINTNDPVTPSFVFRVKGRGY